MIVSVNTPDFCVEDLIATVDAAQRGVSGMAKGIQDAVNYLTKQGAVSLSIQWRKIDNRCCMPDGTLGFFIVSGNINERKT
jgi:hypothetical protein